MIWSLSDRKEEGSKKDAWGHMYCVLDAAERPCGMVNVGR